MITEKEIYTTNNLEEEYGKIYNVELLPTSDSYIQNFFKKCKKKKSPGEIIRENLARKYGEEIRNKIFSIRKENTSLCFSCRHGKKNNCSNSDSTYFVCWKDWQSGRPPSSGKNEIKNCEFYNPQKVNDEIRELFKYLHKKYPKDFFYPKYPEYPVCNENRLAWLVDDLGFSIIPFKRVGGWNIANDKAKGNEADVKTDFIEMGFESQYRWMKITCSKGIKLRQHDGLFINENEIAALVEVKNSFGCNTVEQAIEQLQRYWQILRHCKQFTNYEFYLYLVCFGNLPGKILQKTGQPLEWIEEKWSPEYSFLFPAPAIEKISGVLK